MIAIPNMDKPKACIECEFSCLWANGSTHCMVNGEELFCDGIPQRHDCPLIEIDNTNTELLEFFNEFKKWKASKEVAKYINAVYGERRNDE